MRVGSAPNSSLQLQNILVSSVVSSAWISRPITASQSSSTCSSFFTVIHHPFHRQMPEQRELRRIPFRVRRQHAACFVLESRADELNAHGHARIGTQSNRHAHAAVASDVDGNGEHIGKVHRGGVSDSPNLNAVRGATGAMMQSTFSYAFT